MLTSMQSCVGSSSLLMPGSINQTRAHTKYSRPNIVRMQRLPYNIRKGELQTATSQSSSSRFKGASALSVTCAAATAVAGETQTVTRNPRTITVTPEKVTKPRLDDNGPGLPPRNDDRNGGNGGGGGGDKFLGGLILLGILGILDFLKDMEGELQSKVNDWKFRQA